LSGKKPGLLFGGFNGDTPLNAWFIMEIPMKILWTWMIYGETHIFANLHMKNVGLTMGNPRKIEFC
jgi:hypothetical protein